MAIALSNHSYDDEVRAERNYSDASIINSIDNAFSKYHVVEIGIRDVAPSPGYRPTNKYNKFRVLVSFGERCFKRAEPLLLRDIEGEKKRLVLGSTRLEAAIDAGFTQSNKKCWAIFMEGLTSPVPTKLDLAFAARQAVNWEAVAAPRSEVAKLSEVLNVVDELTKSKGYQLHSITVNHIRDAFPPVEVQHMAPTCSHWSTNIGRDLLHQFLATARVFRTRRIESFLESIEKLAYDPIAQISRRWLFGCRDLEMHNLGSGRSIVERYSQALESNPRSMARLPSRDTQNDEEKAKQQVKRGISSIARGISLLARCNAGNHNTQFWSQVEVVRSLLGSLKTETENLL